MATSRHASEVEIHLTTGAYFINNGAPDRALEVLEHALAMAPNNALMHYNAGIACDLLASYDQAIEHYCQAIELAPNFQQAIHNLAQAYAKSGRHASAKETYQRALALNSNDAASAYNLGLLYQKGGEHEKMFQAFQQALSSKPDFAEVFSALGMYYGQQDRLDEALVCLEQALDIHPELAEAHLNMGVTLQKQGLYEKGLRHYKNASACKPDYMPARWLSMLSLPMLYRSESAINVYRNQFAANLDKLIAATPLDTDQNQRNALAGVRTTTNFYLQYQCRNDLSLQMKYGRFVQNVMAANFPQWTKDKQMPSLDPGEKIRIGYVSSYMHNHTVGIFLTGWLECHTTSDFSIHCYHVGKKVDDVTHHLRNLSQQFQYFNGDMEMAARHIDADDLHLLIYTDIGMDPVTTQLAALRLAPIQCKGWGHPVTTGLPSIDYYLSSDLMEPDNGAEFYSETLVRLPNLALYYHPPPLPEKPITKQELGLPEDRFIYLSTQSIFKYLPQHDDIYPRIAKAVPRACFVFISNQSEDATLLFRARLQTAFAQLGLDVDHYCHFSKKLNFHNFLSLNLAANVLLDSLEWSGGKTTLEAISCGLPVVTCPGRFMRGRHAFAMLTMMECTTTIAEDKSDYCEIAIRLATDNDYYTHIKKALLTQRSKLYRDQNFAQALEHFYHHALSCKIKDKKSVS